MNISTVRIAALVLGTLLTLPVAHAHTPLKASIPEDGAVISIGDLPAELELRFGGTLRLVTVMLSRHDGERGALVTSRTPAVTHEVPLPELVPGEYTVQWRGVAADGHVMSGTLRFTVADH